MNLECVRCDWWCLLVMLDYKLEGVVFDGWCLLLLLGHELTMCEIWLVVFICTVITWTGIVWDVTYCVLWYCWDLKLKFVVCDWGFCWYCWDMDLEVVKCIWSLWDVTGGVCLYCRDMNLEEVGFDWWCLFLLLEHKLCVGEIWLLVFLSTARICTEMMLDVTGGVCCYCLDMNFYLPISSVQPRDVHFFRVTFFVHH
jgi:hypothetical protein